MDTSSEDESPTSTATQNSRTQIRYENFYKDFQKWKRSKRIASVSENVLLGYFELLAKKCKPPTLWQYYSILKTKLKLNEDIDITPWSQLTDYIKMENIGYQPERVKHFTAEQIEKFINEAPDEEWLDIKVVCIFGVNGVYSSRRLIKFMVDDVKQYDDMFLVTIPKLENDTATSTFTITGTFFHIVQKYIELRPKTAKDNRFFVHCHHGNKHYQFYHGSSIGKTKLARLPSKIANYLKLPDAEQYSALSFRITETNSSANTTCGYRSTNVSDREQETGRTLNYDTGGVLKTPSTDNTRFNSATINVNYNSTEHICTLSCGQVKCALEENERSVLHAFSILKPSDYEIVDITSAQFALHPTCRWVVAYNHIREPVSSFNADETFVDITRSKPSNVRINQKYIRGNSDQHLAAYVVVYGVNCRCRKDTLDIFNFTVN